MGIIGIGGKHGIVAFLGNVLVIYIGDLIFGKINIKEDENKFIVKVQAETEVIELISKGIQINNE